MVTPKETVMRLVGQLPDDAGWDDIIYALRVKEKVEAGLKAADEGRVVSHREAIRRLIGSIDNP